MNNFAEMSTIAVWEGACRGFSTATGYEFFDHNDMDDVEPNDIAFGLEVERINDSIYAAHGTGDELDVEISEWQEAFAEFFKRQPRYLSRRLVKAARRLGLNLTPVL